MIEKKQLTLEQRKKIDKLGIKFALKSMWNGAHHGLMAAAMNLILVMVASIYFDNDETMITIGCVIVGIFVFRRILFTYKRDLDKLNEDIKQILK